MVGPEVLLDHNGGRSHPKKLSPCVPTSDAPLENEDFSGEYSIPFLLKEQILSILEEDFGLAKLVISLAQDGRANFGCSGSAILEMNIIFA
jgi:hypothetical protein